MKTFYLTDAGKIRTHNEDSVIILHNDNNEYIMAVADGMGGHKAGEVASSIATEHIKKSFNKLKTIGSKEDAIEWIRSIVTEINNKIFDYTNRHDESKGMGTTLVLAIKTNDYILFGNIGDSSGFVIKNDKMVKVTKDHTLVNLLVEAGNLTEEEAKYHPKKNVLMRALGATEKVQMDIFDVDMNNEGIMLCSDGLTTMLADDQIEKVLIDEELDAEEKVVKLIQKCNARGGFDNVSIAYLEKDEGDN